jgi:hypothetical protein
MKLRELYHIVDKLTEATEEFIIECGKESSGGMSVALSKIESLESDLRNAGFTETQILEARAIANEKAVDQFFEKWT